MILIKSAREVWIIRSLRWEKVLRIWYALHLFVIFAYLFCCVAFTAWHLRMNYYSAFIFIAFIGSAILFISKASKKILPFANEKGKGDNRDPIGIWQIIHIVMLLTFLFFCMVYTTYRLADDGYPQLISLLSVFAFGLFVNILKQVLPSDGILIPILIVSGTAILAAVVLTIAFG